MSYFGKNIRKIRNVKKLSQQAFAELFELKRATLGAYEEERSEPKIETMIKIANYFSITIDDLLTKELTVNKLLKFKDDLALSGTFHKEEFTKIPCIVPDSEQDYILHYEKPHFIEELPCICLPIASKPAYRAYVLTNLEMTENDRGLKPRDIVIGEKVAATDFLKTENSSLVLALAGQRLFLRKFYTSGDKIVLRAANKNIEDTEIDPLELKELWLINFTFSRRVPDNTAALASKLDYLEQEFKKLKEQL